MGDTIALIQQYKLAIIPCAVGWLVGRYNQESGSYLDFQLGIIDGDFQHHCVHPQLEEAVRGCIRNLVADAR